MCIYQMHALCLQRSRKSDGIGVTDSFELPCVLGTEPGSSIQVASALKPLTHLSSSSLLTPFDALVYTEHHTC